MTVISLFDRIWNASSMGKMKIITYPAAYSNNPEKKLLTEV